MPVLCPPVLTHRNARRGPIVEIEAIRPGPIQGTKFIAAEAGERFHAPESDAILFDFHGKARMIGEPTAAGRDYRADLSANWAAGRPTIDYAQWAGAYLRDGPTDPDGDVGPPVKARVIADVCFVAARRLVRCGDVVRSPIDGSVSVKPGEPFAVPEGLLAIPYVNRWVELLTEPTPRFRRFVDAYAAYRQRCERTADPGPCPVY